ncbi:hypothetical protein GO001_12815 [Streptomyces sp. NRRL B-1677]|uniref:transposase family protein n=1 Tax=Streptomyces TaxID=1883 RepID=UPI0011C41ECF|nr:hypothetical protein [Streptomyces sp. NRRL B-1677]
MVSGLARAVCFPVTTTVNLFHAPFLQVSRWILTLIGSRWRRLGCLKQALLTLAHLRKNETFAQVAGGFGVLKTIA